MPGRPLCSPERSRTRRPGLEGELQVVDFTKLVVHLEQRFDHGLDLEGHAIELLERDALELAPNLLVEIEEATQPASRREPPVHLLVRGEDALEAVTDPIARCTDVLHSLPSGGLSGVQFECHGTPCFFRNINGRAGAPACSRLATLHDRTPPRAVAAPLHDTRRHIPPGARRRPTRHGEVRGRPTRRGQRDPRAWRRGRRRSASAPARPRAREHPSVRRSEAETAAPPPHPRASAHSSRTDHTRSESLIDAGFLDTRMSAAVRFAPPFQPPREVLMTKAQLVARLVEGTGASRKLIDEMLASMIETVVKTVKKGESVKIPGLGIFRLRKMKARMGRNPQTGEPNKIPARKTVGFSVAKTVKESVHGNRKK